MQFLIRSILSIAVIIGIMFVVTNFSGTIQQHTGSVLGVTINPKQSEALPEKLRDDITNSVTTVQKNGSAMQVEDITEFLGRTQKIISDYQNAQKEVEKTVNSFFEEKKEKK